MIKSLRTMVFLLMLGALIMTLGTAAFAAAPDPGAVTFSHSALPEKVNAVDPTDAAQYMEPEGTPAPVKTVADLAERGLIVYAPDGYYVKDLLVDGLKNIAGEALDPLSLMDMSYSGDNRTIVIDPAVFDALVLDVSSALTLEIQYEELPAEVHVYYALAQDVLPQNLTAKADASPLGVDVKLGEETYTIYTDAVVKGTDDVPSLSASLCSGNIVLRTFAEIASTSGSYNLEKITAAEAPVLPGFTFKGVILTYANGARTDLDANAGTLPFAPYLDLYVELLYQMDVNASLVAEPKDSDGNLLSYGVFDLSSDAWTITSANDGKEYVLSNKDRTKYSYDFYMPSDVFYTQNEDGSSDAWLSAPELHRENISGTEASRYLMGLTYTTQNIPAVTPSPSPSADPSPSPSADPSPSPSADPSPSPSADPSPSPSADPSPSPSADPSPSPSADPSPSPSADPSPSPSVAPSPSPSVTPEAKPVTDLKVTEKAYDGKPCEVSYKYEGSETVVVEYALKGSDSYSATAPVNAGTYTVRVSAGSESASTDFTISKTEIKIEFKSLSKQYDTKALTLDASAAYTITVPDGSKFSATVKNISGLSVGPDVGSTTVISEDITVVNNGISVDPKNIDLKVSPGKLEITKRSIKLEAKNSTLDFGATFNPANQRNASFKDAAGSEVPVVIKYDYVPYSGSDKVSGDALGTYTLKIENVKVLSGETDISKNFDISTVDAKLTRSSKIDSAEYKLKSAKDVKLTCEMAYDKFVSLAIDGKTMTKGTDYTVASGSTIVTLKSASLDKLKAGDHTVTLNYGDNGSVETTLKIKSAAPSKGVATGDENNPLIWVVIIVICIAAIAALCVVYFKRNRRK